jgi:pilus assembly protein Flp/PilA
MHKLTNAITKLGIWTDTKGQDLIEYALMASFLAVAVVATMPGLATGVSTLLSQVASTLTLAAI